MSEWTAWEKRKRTNKGNFLGNFSENCPFCAHCTWIIVGKTNIFPGADEFYCNRVNQNGMRVTVDMTGRVPEKCEHFDIRSKYATNKI